MKNIALAIIFTFIVFTMAGQNHAIGIIGGTCWTNISANNFPNQNGSRQGVTGGITYEYIFSNHITAGVDFIYSPRGFHNETVHTEDSGTTERKATSEFNYNYISIPIKAGYGTRGNLYGFGNIGLIPSMLINAETTTPTFENGGRITGTETIDITDRVNDFDLAGLIEIGVGQKISKRYTLFSILGYQHSLTTITNSKYFSNSKIQHSGTSLYLGIKYSL